MIGHGCLAEELMSIAGFMVRVTIFLCFWFLTHCEPDHVLADRSGESEGDVRRQGLNSGTSNIVIREMSRRFGLTNAQPDGQNPEARDWRI